MRKQRSWRKDPGQSAIIIGSLILAVATAIVAHFYASPWAIEFEGASLVVTALGVVASFRLRRLRHGWLFFGIAIWAFFFACIFPILQGRAGVAQAIYAIAGLLVISGVIWFSVRLRLSLSHIMQTIQSEADEEVRNEGLFREDGERIVVYMNRGKLLRWALYQLALLAALGLILFGIHKIPNDGDPRLAIAIISLAFVIAWLGVAVLLFIARLVMRMPTLIVSADGITDNGSFLVTGLGLMRWNEIIGVQEHWIDLSKVSWRYRMRYKLTNGALDIDLSNMHAVFKRQSPWKIALIPFSAFGRQPLGRRIIASLLDRPAEQLVEEINEYIKRHAPPGGWHARMVADENDDEEAREG